MRPCVILCLSFMGCLFQPLVPRLPTTMEANPNKLLPEQGCLQGGYAKVRTRRGHYYYVMTQVYKNGSSLANLPATNPTLEGQLQRATGDDPAAHATVVAAGRMNRASTSVGALGITAAIGLLAASLTTDSSSIDGKSPMTTVSPLTTGLLISGFGLFVASTVAGVVLNVSVNPTAHHALALYNEHAAATGCPAP